MQSPNSLEKPVSPTDPGTALLTHSRLLGTRLHLHTWVRALVAVTIITGAYFAQYLVGIEALDVRGLVLLALVIAAYNAVTWILVRPYQGVELNAAQHRYLLWIMRATILLDYLALTVAVWLVGGSRSPFLAFYLLHLILCAVLLSRREAIAFTFVAFVLLTALVCGEWLGMIPTRQPLGAIAGPCELDGRFALTVLVVYGTLFGLTAFLLIGLSELLRQGERRVLTTNRELERLSNMRRDFLHIALHNLQSPIGAITMYLKNMRAGLGGSLTEQQGHWTQRSLSRLEDLNEFLRDLQMLATLESGRIDAEATEFDITPIVQELVDSHQDIAQQHDHRMEVKVQRDVPKVRGLERLIREAIVNYITNAIKYTPAGGRIIVRVGYRRPHVRVEVEDTGIGIAPAEQDRLFNEFARVERRDTPLGQVKGTGLGLSIVRRVIEAHGGRVGVHSRVDQGSTFFIELPEAGSTEAPVAESTTEP
jgi:signal transduction histidine kinase